MLKTDLIQLNNKKKNNICRLQVMVDHKGIIVIKKCKKKRKNS